MQEQAIDREVILNGQRNIIRMAHESDLEILDDRQVVQGGFLSDPKRHRFYQITQIDSEMIVIEEHTLPRHAYTSPKPVDHPDAIGILVENNPQILVKRLSSRRFR
jgi:hypothetical protein